MSKVPPIPATDEPLPTEAVPRPPRAMAVLGLALWCGLVAGLLEVGIIVLRKRTIDPDPFYRMSHHFVWMIPATNLLLCLLAGIVILAAMRPWPRRTWWIASRLLCVLTLLPALLVAFPKILGVAWVMVAVGFSARLVPLLERHKDRFHRVVRRSSPLLAGVVGVLGLAIPVGGGIEQWRSRNRPLPPSGSPNVLLVVLDTVAAGHLKLHGYARPTSTTLEELAGRAIRFEAVRAASSWTLPSHASMFTGRWPHDLSAGWLSPLDSSHTTLAEFLGARGYESAGFVGNTMYCAADSGLGRGFVVYRDYIFPRLTALKLAALVDRGVGLLASLGDLLEGWPGLEGLQSASRNMWLRFSGNRKDAARVNREFLDWHSSRAEPERPFFAFLNYYDAHVPYELPPGRIARFGARPETGRQERLVRDWWPLDKSKVSPDEFRMVEDLYDSCVADLDEQLGRLFDELARRGVLDSIWVIVTADHGESFGEHAGVFCHGTSLYQTELHVPLLILPPGGASVPRLVTQPASLRDLAATVVELAMGDAASPFEGRSLSRFWKPSKFTTPGKGTDETDLPLSEVVPIDPAHLDPSGMLRPRWPLAALMEEGWTYIRREGEVREELFQVSEDRGESRNRAADPAEQSRLGRLRTQLGGLTRGPLTPQRFRP